MSATRCPSLGSIIVGGKTVGVVQCCLDAGHDESWPIWDPNVPVDQRRVGLVAPLRIVPGEPHRAVLEWENDTVAPDLDLLDPAEALVDPLAPAPACQYVHDFGRDATSGATCKTCGASKA